MIVVCPVFLFYFFVVGAVASYLAGIVAGSVAVSHGITGISYLSAFNNPQVNAGLNAFLIGARKIKPDLKIEATVIGSFYYPFAERQVS
jgi:basic membrane protein A